MIGCFAADSRLRLRPREICVGPGAEQLDQLGFPWVIRVQAGTVQVVEPLCEIKVRIRFRIFPVSVPDVVPRLKRLILKSSKTL